jgi:HD-like signal output (HDOD) protein
MDDRTGAVAPRRPDLSESVRATLRSLSQTGELPTLSPTAARALKLARNPDAGIDEMCRVIGSDVGMSARILRVANSAGYLRRTPIRTLEEAVFTLGLIKTSDLIVAASARELLGAGADAGVLWSHALAVAVGAEEIARLTRQAQPALTFLPGLFHDVGRIVFCLVDAASYDAVRQLSASGEGEISDVERIWYGFDHADAGATLAQEWGLGPEQVDAIRWHHQPTQATEGRALAAVLNSADALAYAIGEGSGHLLPADVDLDALGLRAEDAVALAARVRETVAEHRQLLT